MVHPNWSHNDAALPMVTSSSNSIGSNIHSSIPSETASSHVTAQPVPSSNPSAFIDGSRDHSRRYSATTPLTLTSSASIMADGMGASRGNQHTNAKSDTAPTKTTVPGTEATAVDITMAYDKASMPRPPAMGDDHSVPVLGDVAPPPQPNPLTPKYQPAYTSPSSTAHHNANQYEPNKQQYDSTIMGFGSDQKQHLKANDPNPWVGCPQPTMFTQGINMSQNYNFQFEVAGHPQGLQQPTFQSPLQQQLQFSQGMNMNQLHPNVVAGGIPPGMSNQLQWHQPNQHLHQNFHRDPTMYVDQHMQNAYNVMQYAKMEQQLLAMQTNNTAFLSAPYLTAMSPQPLHMSVEQLGMAHQQRNINAHLANMTVQHQGSKAVPYSHEPAKLKSPPSKEWIQSIVGRDWEIFWKKQDSQIVTISKTRTKGKNSKEKMDEGSDDDEDEETWYDATVVAVDTKRSSGSTNMVYFHVKFLGDGDRLFRMPLTSDIVRPSARAWIRRTKAILLPLVVPDVTNIIQWETSLPHDTAIATTDTAPMKKIDDDIESKYPVTLSVTYHQSQNSGANDFFQTLRKEHATIICPLLKLTRHQLYLRSKLSPIDVDHDGEDESSVASMSDDENSVLTEEYVEFLISSLQNLEKACLWHYECWTIMKQLFAVHRDYCKSPTKLISKHYLVQDLLQKGCDLLSQLSRQSNLIFTPAGQITDDSSEYCKRACVSDVVGLSEIKRRRLNEQGAVGAMMGGDDSRLFDVSFVKRFLDQVDAMDQRWYTKCFSYMFQNVFDMVFTPFMDWERNARTFLGEEDYPLSSDNARASDQAKASDELYFSSDFLPNVLNIKRRDVKYEDIESSIESANNDRLLKCFDFSAYVNRLCTKLAEIDKFESDTVKLISKVFEEHDFHMSNDPTLLGLAQQRKEAMRKGSSVKDMNPIGRVTSRLTIKGIESAIANRKWLLNLKRAESTRERESFVKLLTESLPLYDTPMVLDELYERVAVLAQQCSDTLTKTKKIESLLDGRTDEKFEHKRTDFSAIQVVKEVLHGLQSQPHISLAEEKLAIRCDVLEWQSKARNIYSKQTPTFNDIQSLHCGLENIRQGIADNHIYIQIGTLPCGEVDEKIQTFITEEFEYVVRPLFYKTKTLYKESVDLKNRADQIVAALDSCTSHSMGAKINAISNNIELENIQDVLNAYSGSKVDMTETFEKLERIYHHCTKWQESMQLKLQDTTQSCEEIRRFLMQMEPNRPLGINVKPDEKTIALILDALQWYAVLNDFIASSSLDRDLLLNQLTRGMPLLEIYCQRIQNTTQFNILSDAVRLLTDEKKRRANIKSLEVSSLYRDKVDYITSTVDRLTNACTDEQEGGPMRFLYFSLWAISVDDFVSRCGSITFKGQTTLENARNLWNARPVLTQNCSCLKKCEAFVQSLNVQELYDLICDAEEVEKEAQSVMSKVRKLHKQDWIDKVHASFDQLKDIQENVTSRWKNNGQLTLTLSCELEADLRRMNDFVCWLVRVVPYPFLHTENVLTTGSPDAWNQRVPSDVLYSLDKDMPKSHLIHEFSSIQKQIKMVSECALKWEKESACVLNKHAKPLLEGRRRFIVDTRQTFSKEEYDKIVALSKYEVLTKVIIPGEKEIHDLIEHSRKFETEFQSFFTKEYCTECPDVDAIKESSLAAEDGTFYLEMLTGNRLFEDLNVTIFNLRQVADLSDLNTAEKVAFDWIYLLHSWINRIRSSVSADIPYCRHRSIGQARADELISEGDSLLRECPDDLLRLLRLHNIYISTSLSELTVSVKLGAANNVRSHGSILIRLWPFLHNALKSDRKNLIEWNNKTMDLADDFVRLQRGDESRLMKDPKAFLPYYQCRDQAERLLCKLDDLFLTPCRESIEKCSVALQKCRSVIHTKSNFESSQAYANSQYSDDTAVINNSLLLLDALAERKELAGETLPESIEMYISQNTASPTTDTREICRRSLRDALSSALASTGISQTQANALCSMKAWEIENVLHDLYGSEKSGELQAKTTSIKRGLQDIGNLQLTLCVLNGTMTADQLVNMSSDELANPVARKIMEQQTQKVRQSHNLTRQQDTTESANGRSEDVTCKSCASQSMNNVAIKSTQLSQGILLRQETTTNSTDRKTQNFTSKSSSKPGMKESLMLGGISALTKSPVGNLIKAMAKNETSAVGGRPGKTTSIVRSGYDTVSCGAVAPPAPPSLNPLSKSSLKHPGLHKVPVEPRVEPDPPPGFVRNVSDGYVFYLKVHSKDKTISHKIRVQLDGMSVGHKVLPERLSQCGLFSQDKFYTFIQERRKWNKHTELTYKVSSASATAQDELSSITKYADENNYVITMDSKCGMDCRKSVQECRECTALPCSKSYLIPPKFHKRFRDLFHFPDQSAIYIIALKRKPLRP